MAVSEWAAILFDDTYALVRDSSCGLVILVLSLVHQTEITRQYHLKLSQNLRRKSNPIPSWLGDLYMLPILCIETSQIMYSLKSNEVTIPVLRVSL